jgi:GRAM domain
MNTKLNKNEQLQKDGAANLQRGIESVGGKLYLTNQRLIFESHGFNVQRGATTIPVADIRTVKASWTKLLGLIPIMPNSLTVTTSDGTNYSFVLLNRRKWATAIERAL